jgi:secreted trypsin-like serine protease
MICAGSQSRGGGECGFDAGSPLIDLEGFQIGVLSSGQGGCSQTGLPAIYSRVSWASEWIEQIICIESAFEPSFCASLDLGAAEEELAEEERADVEEEGAIPDITSFFS